MARGRRSRSNTHDSGTKRSTNSNNSSNNSNNAYGGGGSHNHSSKGVVVKIKPRTDLKTVGTSLQETITLLSLYIFLFSYTFIIFFGEALLLPPDELDWCQFAQRGYPGPLKIYENPDHITDPCYHENVFPYLLFLSRNECDWARRMLLSVLFGAAIGYERKNSERPAGIRTMSLVSLGACCFTLSSQRAFKSSTMGWDAARVSAAIPSGVGFLGSALIWKGGGGSGDSTKDSRPEVHGLTTAASVWLSAAVGVGVGGRLIVVSAYMVTLILIVLRIGPRLYMTDDISYGREIEVSVSDNDSIKSSNDGDDDYDNDHISPDEMRRLLVGDGDDNAMKDVSSMMEEEEQQTGAAGAEAVKSEPTFETPLKDHGELHRSSRSRSRRAWRRERKHRSLSPRKHVRPSFHN